MNPSLSGVSAPLPFPSKLTAPVKQRKPRTLPAGVASFAHYAYERRYRIGGGMQASAEVAAQEYGLSPEDRRFLKVMIRAYEEQVAGMICKLIRNGEVNHG